MRPCTLALLCLFAGCRVAGGPGFSAGSVGVPGTATGIGGGIEAELHHRSGFAAALSADFSGYATEGDADPLLWAELSARYRIPLFDDHRDRYRVFFTPGVGLGYAWCCYVDDTVLAGFLEVAAERNLGGVRLGLSARWRPALFIGGGDPFGGGGDPYVEPYSTLALAFTIGIGR